MVVQQNYRTTLNEIFIDEFGILYLKPDHRVEIDEIEVEKCFEIYKKMGIGPDNKVLQIIDVQFSFSITREGRDYAATHGNDFFIASAIITNNLAVRLVANFFTGFYKNRTVPIRLFEDKESATKWLLQFRNTEK